MTNNRKFVADVEAFASKTADQMLRVAKQSIQDVVTIAQTPVSKGGNMPVDTGFLRNSLTSQAGGSVSAGGDDYILTIAGMRLGDDARFAWSAEYAIARHYKPSSFGQGGGMWRDLAAQQWPAIVAKNARAVK